MILASTMNIHVDPHILVILTSTMNMHVDPHTLVILASTMNIHVDPPHLSDFSKSHEHTCGSPTP